MDAKGGIFKLEEKKVTYKHLKIGQEIKGTEGNGCYTGFTAYVKAINPAYITVEKWKKGGPEEKLDASLLFLIEMSEEEFEAKYRTKAKEVLKGIQNRLHGDEIGYHEMWNAWLYGSPYEIAQACTKDKFCVIGHSKDIIPKHTMFGDEILDVGVCGEYEDGERFWCHFSSENIAKMLNLYKELLD